MNGVLRILSFFCALGISWTSLAESPSPREVETTAFNSDWYFRLGEYDVVRAGYAAGDWEKKGGWDLISLPHSFNAGNTFTTLRGYYRGIGWYRKQFSLTEQQTSREVFLKFGAAYSVAEIWVNEQPFGKFTGGFTPIVIDVTKAVHAGANLVAVKVSNAHDPDVLPGKDIPDYCLYGGMYREAALVIKDKVHISEDGFHVFTPKVSKASGHARADVTVRNSSAERKNGICVVELLDGAQRVAQAQRAFTLEADKEITLSLELPVVRRPQLWSVDRPYLYQAVAHIVEAAAATQKDALVANISTMNQVGANTVELDRATTALGFRFFEFTADKGFWLNGERVELRGVNRHQDYPGLGNALPAWMQVRDVQLMKDAGANFVRASHYPQAPAFLDACDRLGVLVYEEICSWQYVGGPKFSENAEAMMRAMIARDVNHPAIVLWGLFNEGRSLDLFQRLHAAAKSLDPARPTAYAENSPDEGLKLGTAQVPDVLGLNYSTGKLAEIHASMPGKPLFSSEYAAVSGGTRRDLERQVSQIIEIKKQLDPITAQPFMAGHTLWSMHDYSTDYWGGWPVHHSGVLDAWRLPKDGWYYMQSRWQTKPMLHICGHWTWPGFEGRTRNVSVVSNCQRVELFLNGRSLGVRTGQELAQWEVLYEAGELRASGEKDSRRIEETIRTASAAVSLALELSQPQIAVGARDAIEITATLRDASGVTVPGNDIPVEFSVDGPGVLRGVGGAPSCTLELGTGRIILQRTGTGVITVHAKTPAGIIGSVAVAAAN